MQRAGFNFEGNWAVGFVGDELKKVSYLIDRIAGRKLKLNPDLID